MSVTLGEALSRAVGYLRERAVREARRDAELLVCRAVGVDRTRLYSHPETPLAPAQLRRLQEDLERRGTGYPLQYLLGIQEFYGREFIVSEAVLIPRPETEVVVELALELLASTPAPAVLDVGTGSGCIAVTIACERPDSQVTATDVSGEALEVAAENARRLGAGPRVRLVRGNLLEPVRAEGFDLVVSNPPYVAEADPRVAADVRRWEPKLAVFAGKTGLELHQRLLAEADTVLRSGGFLVLEAGQGQVPAIEQAASTAGWELSQVREDLAGIPRAVAFQRR
jgi:release factor glutamine methyltransferase